MQADYDVIVVGAGPAGSAAALSLARKGADVLMLEKARVPGERNMTGGVIYGDFPGDWGLIQLVPDFESTAPLERRIISHEVVILDKPDYTKGTSRYYKLSKTSLPTKMGLFPLGFETGHDYSVLRRSFDRWFAGVAVQAGAMLSAGTTAEGLLIEGGAVVGVRTPKEELRAKLVIDASGVTSNLVAEAGLRGRLTPRQLYHGIKRVYKLDPAAIEQRFRVHGGEGRAIFFLGDFMNEIGGGAFVYTNRDTLSVGLVVSMDSLIRRTTEHFDRVGKLIDVLDAFEEHPMVAELLEGGRAVEYSAHNIPKGYKALLKKPYADGFLVAGDALGSFVKIGPMIDGMRRAITSGMMAASSYLEASASGSFKAKNLSRYKDLLGPIYDDVGRSGRDGFITESSFTYHTLPRLIFGTRLISSVHRFEPKPDGRPRRDAVARVQEGTGLLAYDEDESYSHIRVDPALASKSLTKPWVPACPTNCYTIFTPKGVFASFKDLYEHNLAQNGGDRGKAVSRTFEDIGSSELRFDHVACVACGTCGAIGPPEMVAFGHERDGHGVRYRFG
ncbi:MAG: FAD-dependent oxidoreductase [Nitrososphaerota archaeon]|nr:FAD-dependent oxidoreductase [Nitrososphaerota archaeon]MDG6974671.1 FAD-dependent oxidoreductase [Nitrososphaerota archaeon]MDG7016172.1 FAD-dependent oxidoreductase [Nitrososphaerota archaeon]MDG7018637.1 FAD-dependent oxidoreductase [Nitrososphaerota archaeon]MDG7020075.1 FAD-dependent oxidoreductase [Nitrososphaerota archaeon]